jgi:glycosyltransferase involved in cell wall biosynthesis
MTSGNRRVSVIVPAFNAERFLAEALDSLTSQTFTDLEIIVVNDGSTDTSGAIAERCASADDRIKVVHQDNEGVSATLNKAASVACGDLIARLDADDLAEPDRLEKQVSFMDANPKVVCCGSAIRYIDEDGAELRRRAFPLTNTEIQERIINRGCYAHPAVIYRRATFESVGRYRQTFDSAEDLDLFLRLSETGEMANLPGHLCAYRLHGSQVTHKPSSSHRLLAFLAAISAIERRRGRLEFIPDKSRLIEMSIEAIEQWLSDDRMTWTRYMLSAIYALHSFMPRDSHASLSLKVARELLRRSDFAGSAETAWTLTRATFRRN